MISKNARLPIKTFPRAASRIANPYFILKISSNTEGFNRFGVIIGAKLEKSSVQRHKLKRRLLAILGKWPNTGADILVIPGPKIKELKTYISLKAICDEALVDFIKKRV